MDKRDFIVVPKLIGLIVDPDSGEVAGMVDASAMLTEESQASLTETLGEVVASVQIESDREELERMYRLPARDVAAERRSEPRRSARRRSRTMAIRGYRSSVAPQRRLARNRHRRST